MGIPVQFLNREKHTMCSPLSSHCSLWVVKRTGSSPGKDDPACSKGLQDHVWSKGVSQRHWGISYFFLKTHMDGKQRTLNHLDQGKKVKVNDGKDAGPSQGFFGLAAAHSTGNSKKNFSSYVLKSLPEQSVPVVQYPNIQKAFQKGSPLRAHCTVSPPEAPAISWLELRTQPFKYNMEKKNLKYQHIIHSMQQAWKGSGRDGAFIVSTERT